MVSDSGLTVEAAGVSKVTTTTPSFRVFRLSPDHGVA